MRRSCYIPRPPAPVDAAALAAVEALAEQLAAMAAPLGIAPRAGETLGCAAHREAVAIEKTKGCTSRSRALQSVASANGAIHRAREAARGVRSELTMAWRIGRARDEMAMAREAIETLTLPIAAE